MKAVCIVDTSIFCALLRVPGMHPHPEEIIEQFVEKRDQGEGFVLPLATILETGNHIGQHGDGRQRREVAEHFKQQVKLAYSRVSPFQPTTPFLQNELEQWLDEFPDWAMRTDSRGKGSGLGDLTIVKLFEQQCARNRGRRVYVWSLDEHLSGYDRPPRP